MPWPDDASQDGAQEGTRNSPAVPHLTLAMRMAERSRLRAERLARLVPARIECAAEPPAPPPAPAGVPFISHERDAAAALEEFLRSLNRGLDGASSGVAPAPGEVLPFQRPAPLEADAGSDGADLERLAGVGPGLVWALRHAGVPDLASVAALEPEALAARLGPLGRLIPARVWVEAARDGA